MTYLSSLSMKQCFNAWTQQVVRHGIESASFHGCEPARACWPPCAPLTDVPFGALKPIRPFWASSSSQVPETLALRSISSGFSIGLDALCLLHTLPSIRQSRTLLSRDVPAHSIANIRCKHRTHVIEPTGRLETTRKDTDSAACASAA